MRIKLALQSIHAQILQQGARPTESVIAEAEVLVRMYEGTKLCSSHQNRSVAAEILWMNCSLKCSKNSHPKCVSPPKRSDVNELFWKTLHLTPDDSDDYRTVVVHCLGQSIGCFTWKKTKRTHSRSDCPTKRLGCFDDACLEIRALGKTNENGSILIYCCHICMCVIFWQRCYVLEFTLKSQSKDMRQALRVQCRTRDDRSITADEKFLFIQYAKWGRSKIDHSVHTRPTEDACKNPRLLI